MKHEEFDIAFVDFSLPIMDGLQCLKLFREWLEDEKSRSKKSVLAVSSGGSPRPDAKSPVNTPRILMNENLLLVGMSDNICIDHAFENNNMHFFCSKPINNQLLMIILKAARTCDNVDEMLIQIETNAGTLFSHKNKHSKSNHKVIPY